MFNQVSLNSVLVILVNQLSSKITLIRHNGSLGPGLRIGEKRKKIDERSKPRGSLRRGPFPLSGPPLSSLRWPIFFLFDPVFAFFSHCRAWSQANTMDLLVIEIDLTSLPGSLWTYIMPLPRNQQICT